MPSFLTKIGRTFTREKKPEETSTSTVASTGNGTPTKLGRSPSKLLMALTSSSDKEKTASPRDTPLAKTSSRDDRGLAPQSPSVRPKSPIRSSFAVSEGETLKGPATPPPTLPTIENEDLNTLTLDVKFDSEGGPVTVDKKKLQETRLSPAETLQLTKSCSTIITERGMSFF